MIIKTIVLCDDRYRFLTSGFRALVACASVCARAFYASVRFLSRTTGTDYRQAVFFPPLHTTSQLY